MLTDKEVKRALNDGTLMDLVCTRNLQIREEIAKALRGINVR